MENFNYIQKFYELLNEFATKEKEPSCLHIGSTAPEFTADTTFGTTRLSDYKGKWLILFSHPGDFTPHSKRLKLFNCIKQY